MWTFPVTGFETSAPSKVEPSCENKITSIRTTTARLALWHCALFIKTQENSVGQWILFRDFPSCVIHHSVAIVCSLSKKERKKRVSTDSVGESPFQRKLPRKFLTHWTQISMTSNIVSFLLDQSSHHFVCHFPFLQVSFFNSQATLTVHSQGCVSLRSPGCQESCACAHTERERMKDNDDNISIEEDQLQQQQFPHGALLTALASEEKATIASTTSTATATTTTTTETVCIIFAGTKTTTTTINQEEVQQQKWQQSLILLLSLFNCNSKAKLLSSSHLSWNANVSCMFPKLCFVFCLNVGDSSKVTMESSNVGIVWKIRRFLDGTMQTFPGSGFEMNAPLKVEPSCENKTTCIRTTTARLTLLCCALFIKTQENSANCQGLPRSSCSGGQRKKKPFKFIWGLMDHRCGRKKKKGSLCAHCAFPPHNFKFLRNEQFFFFTQRRNKMNQQKCNIDTNSHCHNAICIWVWLEITCLIV